MELIAKEDAVQALIDCGEVTGSAFRAADEAINILKPRAVIRDCDGCFGASFNDCSKCDKFAITRE